MTNSTQTYLTYVRNNVTEPPDAVADGERFSELHSWYKHLPAEGKLFYALLQRGEQPRYPFSKSFTSTDQTKFHWHFIKADACHRTAIELSDDLCVTSVPPEVVSFLSRYPLLFTDRLGTPGDNSCEEIKRVTDRMWEYITSPRAIERAEEFGFHSKTFHRAADEQNYSRQEAAKLLQKLRSAWPNLVETRDQAELWKTFKATRLTSVDGPVCVMYKMESNYTDLGILDPKAVRAISDGIDSGLIGFLDIIDAYTQEGLMADHGRELVRKVIGDRADEYLYLSNLDWKSQPSRPSN